MKMDNRVLEEYNRWGVIENQLGSLFTENRNSPRYVQRKLDHLEKIELKYKGSKNLGERAALDLLRNEIDQLKKKIYPAGWWGRVLAAIDTIFRKGVQEKELKREYIATAANEQTLGAELVKMGLGGWVAGLNSLLKEGKDSFRLPVSFYTRDKEKVDLEIAYTRNDKGLHGRTSMEVEYRKEEAGQTPIKVALNSGKDYDIAHIIQMMRGKSFEDGDGSWKRLDSMDRDEKGRHKIRVYNGDYGEDLREQLNKFPAKIDADAAYEQLKKGSQYQLFIEKNGRSVSFWLEADPPRGFSIYDERSKKISVSQMLGQQVGKELKAGEGQKNGTHLFLMNKERLSRSKGKGLNSG